MARSRRATPKMKDKNSVTAAFYSADNWAMMKWIGMKLAELRSKLKDKELAEVADDFNVIERRFDRMYRKVGEEIWIINENHLRLVPEMGPCTTKIGRKGRVPAKQLEYLKKLPGVRIEVRLPGEETVKKFKTVNEEEKT